MSIKDKLDLENMRRVARIVRACLEAMRQEVRPGVTTAQLNRVGAEVLTKSGARSAPMLVYEFPAETCISVNDELVHGIPSDRILQDGDLVKLDVTAEKDGYMADSAITVGVGSIDEESQALIDCARSAFERAMESARAGQPIHAIGLAVQTEVERRGFAVVPELTGHGIGRTIHEKPIIPNYYDPRDNATLTEGLVITVEPIIAAGAGHAVPSGDGWTLRNADRSRAAHHEHTLVITRDRPIILTDAA